MTQEAATYAPKPSVHPDVVTCMRRQKNPPGSSTPYTIRYDAELVFYGVHYLVKPLCETNDEAKAAAQEHADAIVKACKGFGDAYIHNMKFKKAEA